MLVSIFNVRGQIGKRPTFETMSLWMLRVESQLSEGDDRFKFLGVFMDHRKSNYDYNKRYCFLFLKNEFDDHRYPQIFLVKVQTGNDVFQIIL